MTLKARSVTDHTSDKIEKVNTWEYIQKCGLVEKFFRIFMMSAGAGWYFTEEVGCGKSRSYANFKGILDSPSTTESKMRFRFLDPNTSITLRHTEIRRRI